MSLAKQKLPIPFARGISTGEDDKQLAIGGLTTLENGIFDTINKIKKRNGLTSLSNITITEAVVTNGRALSNFNNELNQYTDKRFYTYSKSLDRWIDKGRAFNIVPTSTAIIRNSYEQSNPVAASVNDINVYAWEDSRGGIRVSVIDNLTDASFIADQSLSSTGTCPKIAVLNNVFYIFYIIGVTVRYKKIQYAQPSSISSEGIIVGDLDASNLMFDVKQISDKIYFAYKSSAANTFQLKYMNAAGTVFPGAALTENPSEAICICTDAANRVTVAYASTTEVKALVYNLTLTTQIMAPTLIETVANVLHVSVINEFEDDFDIVYQVSAAATYNHVIRKSGFNIIGTVVTPSVLFRSVGLASHLFQISSTNYFLMMHESVLQSTYFMADYDGNIVAKISPDLGGKLITQGRLHRVSELTDSAKVLLASQVKGLTVTENNNFYSLLGVNSTIVDFDPETFYQDEVLGDNLHISGGVLLAYDGNIVTEHGFHLYPENLTAGVNAAVGGAMSNGTYLYTAVYAWTDNKGQIHRSAASVAISVTTTAGGATQTQQIIIPTLRLTAKPNAIIELYRTEDQGSIFYKVTSVTAPTFNDKTVDTITITDTLSDLQLLDRELLYTTGDVLENIAAPSSKFITAFGNRIMLAGLEDPNTIVYSKIREEGEPVAFNDALRKLVEPEGGPISGIGVMDEKFIIFKNSRIYFFSGDGPTNAGTLDNFTEPQQISTDVGCIAANSIVLTPMGLMFKSAKGIYLLTRDLQTLYIGKRVERFNALNISAAILQANNNQVRFITSNGATMVYDYIVNEWATFTNYKGYDGAILDNVFYLMHTDGSVKKEVEGQFNDDGVSILLTVETGWISANQMQGYKRVYNMYVLGEAKSRHKLRVRVAYNFDDGYLQEGLVNSDDFIDFTPYGGYSPYGAPVGGTYGGKPRRYQFKVNFKKQKCQSIRLKFNEIQDTDIGEGLSLSNMMLLIGAKTGGFKIDGNREVPTDTQ